MNQFISFQNELFKQQQEIIRSTNELVKESIQAQQRTLLSVTGQALEFQKDSVDLIQNTTKNYSFLNGWLGSIFKSSNPIIESIKIQQDFMGKMLNKF